VVLSAGYVDRCPARGSVVDHGVAEVIGVEVFGHPSAESENDTYVSSGGSIAVLNMNGRGRHRLLLSDATTVQAIHGTEKAPG